jgi:hypothetical protein
VQRRYGARAHRTYDERDQFNDAPSPSTSTQHYPRRPRRVIDSLPPARSHHTYPPGEDEANIPDIYHAERPPVRRSSRYLRQDQD